VAHKPAFSPDTRYDSGEQRIDRTRQSERFEIPEAARRTTPPPPNETMRVAIPESLKQLSIPTPARAIEIEPLPQTTVATVKVGRRRYSPFWIRTRELASAFLLFVGLLGMSLLILRVVARLLFID